MARLGLEWLVAATALHHLRGRDVFFGSVDVLFAVGEPVPIDTVDRERRSLAAMTRPMYRMLGFSPYRSAVWLLHDWSALDLALASLRERFGVYLEEPFCGTIGS